MRNKSDSHHAGSAGRVLGAVLWLAALAGCNREAPPQAAVAPSPAAVQPAPAQPVVVETQPTVVMQDDYVYYPDYEVYYSSNRHQYVYRDGSVWVTRPTPPRVSVGVLFASPSVRMDFHDSPERHHESVIHNYPRGWKAPGNGRGDRDDHRNDGKDDKRDHR